MPVRSVIALLAVAGLAASYASAREFDIRYHERVERLNTGTSEQLSFIAHGRQFDLVLESNAGIVAFADSQPPDVTLYRGRVSGQLNSWVRLSETDGRLSGAIFDGEEIWLLDSSDRLADYLASADPARGDDIVIFRLSDVSGSMGDVVANAVQPEPQTAFASFGPQPGRVLDIGLVATTDFLDQHGARANDRLLELFNVIEGIFITQVGVQLRAAEVSVLDSTPPELLDTDAQQLLTNFSNYKVQSQSLYPLGLAHLFVSRDLDDSNPPIRTVGIANLGVLCDRRFGVGITQATHATILDALIAAHEIGHNFGAPHDAETGSVCAAEPDDFIMAAKINGSTQFSQCSIDQMLPEIQSASCMREIPPTDLQLSVDTPPPAQIEEHDTIEFDLVLSNLSNTNVAGVELTAAATKLSRISVDAGVIADGYCDTGPELRCVWPWLPAGASVLLNMSASAGATGADHIDVAVDSLHELDPSDNAVQFDVEILPLAELQSGLSPARHVLHPGESARFEAAISNRGHADATGVIANISLGNGALELADIELRGCSQSGNPEQPVYACPIGTLGAGRAWSFGFSVRVPEGLDMQAIEDLQTVSVFATSDAIASADAISAQATVTIGETISDLGVTINGPALVEVDREAVWEIEVTNHGPDPADAVRVFDIDVTRMLPSSAVRVSTASAGECTLSSNNTEFDCTFPTLGVGEKAMIQLIATPAETGHFYWVEATAESAAPDGDHSNDQTSLLVSVNTGDDFELVDTTTPGANTAGDSGGGGGSTGVLTLLGLLALICSARRRSPRPAVTSLKL